MNTLPAHQDPSIKEPWTVLDVAKGIGEERARELLNERLELKWALESLLALHNDAVLICGNDDEERVRSALSRATALLNRIRSQS